MCAAVVPSHGKEICLVLSLRISPTAAGAIENEIADESVLKSGALRFGYPHVVCCGNGLAAVGKAGDRHAHQCYVPGNCFRSPHAVTIRFRAEEDVQVSILTLEERELVHRASGYAQGARTRTVERH